MAYTNFILPWEAIGPTSRNRQLTSVIVNISEIIQVGFLSNIEILLFIITNSFLTLD